MDVYLFYSGGTIVTATGRNIDSVEEPVMVVNVSTSKGANTYFQVVQTRGMNILL